MNFNLESITKFLNGLGINGVNEIIYNPSFEELYQYETDPSLKGFEAGQKTELGAINVMTGVFTGRSPKDEYFVEDAITKDTIWWTSDKVKNDNKPTSQAVWNDLKKTVADQLSNKKLFIVDAYCGANENTRLKVRFIMEVAWQAHFVKNMFIRPTEEELKNFGEPDFTVINGSKTTNKNWEKHGSWCVSPVVACGWSSTKFSDSAVSSTRTCATSKFMQTLRSALSRERIPARAVELGSFQHERAHAGAGFHAGSGLSRPTIGVWTGRQWGL